MSIGREALRGGCLLGGVGFTGGYVGPLLFMDSNLGPLIGIFLTGPLGFVLGTLIGGIVAWRRRRR